MEESIFKFSCGDKSFYENETFRQALEKFIEKYSINSNPEEALGQVDSTSYYSWQPDLLLKLDGFGKLKYWIFDKIMCVSDSFGIKNPKDIRIFRAWVNKMYFGSEGSCHIHKTHLKHSGVAIFYIQVPENGSNLFIVKDGSNGSLIKDYPPNELFEVEVCTGDLIIHKNDLPHAVSRHNNNTPRICLVIDFEYV